MSRKVMDFLGNKERNDASLTTPSVQTSRKPYDSRQCLKFPAQLLVLVDVHLTKSFSDIALVLGTSSWAFFRTFIQYLRELVVLSMYNGYRPVSPYTMWFGVLLLTYNSLLQAKRCADSMTDTLAVPHISDAYNSIGLICASKSWKKHCCI